MPSKYPRIIGHREPTTEELNYCRHPGLPSSIERATAQMPFIIVEFDDGSQEEIRVGKSVIRQLFKMMEQRMSPTYAPKLRTILKFEPLPTTPSQITSRYNREDPV